MNSALRPAIALLVGHALTAAAWGQTTTAFTYQGRLESGGTPANGVYDLQFGLFSAASGGSPVRTVCVNDVSVVGGLFTATVDFGVNTTSPFVDTFVGLRVRADGPNASCDFTDPAFATLSPRQPITPAPVAASLRNVAVDATGRLGVGSTAPLSRVEVQGGANSDGTLDPVAMSLAWRSGGFRHFIRSRHDGIAGGGNAIDFYMNNSSAANGSASPGVGNIQALTISGAQNGSIGIRNTNPTAPLSITGRTGGPSSSDSLLSLRNNANSELWNINLKGDDLTIWDTTSSLARITVGHTSATALRVAGTTTTGVLTITGGSDIAEPFEIAGDIPARPGMVVSIDPARTGGLCVSTGAYDHSVAGVVSGANGINAGLTLTQEGSVADGKHPVALTGRVWVLADATHAPIGRGDLLTTSDLPGHAMKAADRERASGATIGKAMSTLDSGTGYVLVLVNLQ